MVVKPPVAPRRMSWTLGTCKNTQTYYLSTKLYTESCCLDVGTYQLTCYASDAYGWYTGFIQIGDTKYCDNFGIGSQESRIIDISGNWNPQINKKTLF